MVSLDVRPSGAGIDARSGPKRRPASNEVEHCSRAGRSAPPVEAVLSRSGGPKTPGPRFLDPLEGITGIRGPSVPPDRRPTAKSGPRKVDADEGDSIDMGDAATPATDGSTGPTGTAIVAPTLTLTARSTRETNGTWLLLTLASGVGSATGMVVESALMAGIGLTLMFACMLSISFDSSACGARCWGKGLLLDGAMKADLCTACAAPQLQVAVAGSTAGCPPIATGACDRGIGSCLGGAAVTDSCVDGAGDNTDTPGAQFWCAATSIMSTSGILLS